MVLVQLAWERVIDLPGRSLDRSTFEMIGDVATSASTSIGLA